MRTAVAIPPSAASEAAGLAQIAKVKALAALGRGDPIKLAAQFGSARVQKAVSAMSTANTADLVDQQIIVAAFLQQLRNNSAFYRLLDGGMIRAPFRARISMVAADASAWVVGEGKPTPVGSLTLDALYLEPQKAASLIVVSEELLKSTQSERNLTLALRRAIAAAVDARFFATVIDGDTPTMASTGTTAADAVADIKALLDAVEPKAESSLLFVMAPDVQRAATLTNVSGNFQFPDLGPIGGSILGIPAMPSDQLAAGTMVLVDATGIAGESGGVEIEASGAATIEMLASALQQDTTTGAGTNLVSMFQTNSVAIQALVAFDAERLRDNAIAEITEIQWA